MDVRREAPIKRSVEDVFGDFRGRREGLIKALTTDFERFYQECDPEKENLCLYGLPNGSWEVNVPVDEVPPELPEPILGINFAKEGMCTSEWISLVAIHSDAWLISLAFYFGARFMFAKNDRKRLFEKINGLPNIFEVVTAKQPEQLSTNQSNVFEVVTAKQPEQLSTNQSNGFEVVTAKQPERLSTNQSNGFEVFKPEQLSTNQSNGFEVVTAKQPEQLSTNQSNGNRTKPSSKMPQSRSFEPQPKRLKMSLPPKEDGDSDEEEEEADEQGTCCGACGDDNDVDEFWICCDVCEIWFHGQCVNITPAKAKHIDQYKCPSCSSNKKARVH